jgi:hypothetical protein
MLFDKIKDDVPILPDTNELLQYYQANKIYDG